LLAINGRAAAVVVMPWMFMRAVADAHPRKVRLLKYGSWELEEVLADAGAVRAGESLGDGGFVMGERVVRTLAELESSGRPERPTYFRSGGRSRSGS